MRVDKGKREGERLGAGVRMDASVSSLATRALYQVTKEVNGTVPSV